MAFEELRNLFKMRDREDFDNYWNSEGHKALFVVIYLLLNVCLFFGWLGAFVPAVGSPGVSGAVPVAKGFGMVLNFNCALIFVPVLRNFLSWVRGTRVNDWVPIDKAIVFHMRVGYVIVIASIGHTVAHYINYGVTSTGYKAFGSLRGISGFILLILILTIFFAALERVRRSRFEIFFAIHHLFVPFSIINLIHGPIFMYFFAIPGIAYFIERMVRAWRGSRPTTLIRTRYLASNVISLEMSKRFEYKPGQYVFLNCPYLSQNEWHPFTITSSPDQDFLSVHIRVIGDWTGALARLLNPTKQPNLVLNKAVGPDGSPLIRVDGPFGAASEDAFSYPVSILVGAGIGVTPFASILKSIRHRFQTGRDVGALKKVYFFWINRDKKEFEWFADLMHELETSGVSSFLELNAYLTGALSLDEVRVLIDKETGGAAAAAAAAAPTHGPDTITGLESKTHFGRPQFDKIFPEIADTHPGCKVGVFFCGPRPLSKKLYDLCRQFTGYKNCVFEYRKENF